LKVEEKLDAEKRTTGAEAVRRKKVKWGSKKGKPLLHERLWGREKKPVATEAARAKQTKRGKMRALNYLTLRKKRSQKTGPVKAVWSKTRVMVL